MLYSLFLAFVLMSSTPWQPQPLQVCFIVVDDQGVVREVCPPRQSAPRVNVFKRKV